MVVLDDGSFIALATSNTNEHKALDRMSEWLTRVDGFPTDGEIFTVQGDLRNLTEKDILKIYQDFIIKCGVSLDDSRIRYVVLDTSAGREQLYFIIAGVVAVVAVALFIRSRMKKKKEIESIMDEAASDDPAR